MNDFLNTLQHFFVYDSTKPLLFNSKTFLLLFLAFYALYIATKKTYVFRIFYVFLFSVFFYYKCSGVYFLLLIISSILDYYIANLIYKTDNQQHKKLLVTVSVFINLGILAYFKYTNFFIENINAISNLQLNSLNIFLPIGISFYTFQTMSYTIDIYRKKLKPAKSFDEFIFYVSFFPQLVAGPIVRAAQFIPQIAKVPKLSNYAFNKAMLLIMSGLLKKAVISDYISVNFVDRVFDNPQLYSSFENLLACYGYTIQIYCDFSGYSDIAIGIALLMGFRLPLNFRSPYQSTSITEFWKRWHISLSSWLRDYLYISLGGNRKGNVRTYINLFLVMFLGGLWHGAAWKFAVWGTLHGCILAIERFIKSKFSIPKTKIILLLGWLFTFNFVAFTWIFFRAENYKKAFLIINSIQNLFTDSYKISDILYAYKYVIILSSIAIFTHLISNKYLFKCYFEYKKIPFIGKSIIFGMVIWIVYLFKSSSVQPFIYFQF